MKTNINKVELIGYAGKDAEFKEIKKGVAMTRFSLATSEGYKNRNNEWVNNTSWHNIVVWNENATKAADAVKKGACVSVTGKLNYRNYEGKDGQKRYTVEIVAETVEIVN
jgi:single-strand DNA-binding protein